VTTIATELGPHFGMMSAMPRVVRPLMRPVLGPVVMIGLLSLAAVGCSDDEPETGATPTSVTFPTTTTSTTTTSEPDDDLDGATTDGSSPDASTAATTPITAVTPEPTVTTTTEPLMLQELILRDDGLGSAKFGATPDGVIEYVTSVLGGNTGDTGWVDPFTFADCGAGGAATRARRVDWGVLSLLFSDASDYAFERDHFMGYEYGRVGQIGDEPAGLHTPGNVGLGSRVIDLLAEFPTVAINDGDDDVGIPTNFYVSDDFYGLLTGIADDDVVTVVFGGYGCADF
jgi:hypothetical protein